jgi:outer membrane murein-binding lipoprotein Lpp
LKNKALRSVIVLAGLGVALFAAGCSENPPCNTDPSQVETARAAAQSAEQGVTSAQAELDQAKRDKSQLENQLDTLPDTQEMDQKLEVLKKGSGR